MKAEAVHDVQNKMATRINKMVDGDVTGGHDVIMDPYLMRLPEEWLCDNEVLDTMDTVTNNFTISPPGGDTQNKGTKLCSMHEGWEYVELHRLVMKEGYPNAWNARQPVKCGWDLDLLQKMLIGYYDGEVVTFMRYGWPVSRPPNWPDPKPTFSNHKGALEFPTEMNKYIDKERSYGAVIGPFEEVPFTSRIAVSPLSSREKKDSSDRRVIMDLSWPPGCSVNDGIAKDQFMGFTMKLSYSVLDEIAQRVHELGTDAQLFKVDLKRYFRQLPIDPCDYSLLCFTWQGKAYFDVVSPMGLHSTPQFAQRVSNAIRYIHERKGYFLFNYIDDFIGAEQPILAWHSLNCSPNRRT